MKNNLNDIEKLRRIFNQTKKYSRIDRRDDVNYFCAYYYLLSDAQKLKAIDKFKNKDYDFRRDTDFKFTKDKLENMIADCADYYDKEQYIMICKLNLLYLYDNIKKDKLIDYYDNKFCYSYY